MIEVKHEENKITVSGHAGYAPIGQDVVCAGVSTLAQNLIASIEIFTEDQIKYVMQPGTVHIQHGDLSEAAQLLVDSFFVGINLIANSYPDYVRVSKH
jgi:uncharacterized protein YsxB (DUF464 family)